MGSSVETIGETLFWSLYEAARVKVYTDAILLCALQMQICEAAFKNLERKSAPTRKN